MSELRPVPKPKKRPQKARQPIRRSRVRQKAGKPKRFRARRDVAYAAWIREQPCILTGRTFWLGWPKDHQCSGRVEAAHVQSRGAAGADRSNMVPLCHREHQDQHALGISTWATAWFGEQGLDELKKLAQQYTEWYDRERSVG